MSISESMYFLMYFVSILEHYVCLPNRDICYSVREQKLEFSVNPNLCILLKFYMLIKWH